MHRGGGEGSSASGSSSLCGGLSAPKSRAGRRVVTFGPKTADAPEEQRNATLRRRDEDLVFGHPDLGTRSTLEARRLRA